MVLLVILINKLRMIIFDTNTQTHQHKNRYYEDECM